MLNNIIGGIEGCVVVDKVKGDSWHTVMCTCGNLHSCQLKVSLFEYQFCYVS